MSYQKIREIIERNDSIVIYRHIHPDYDAIGSQLGLYFLILKRNYTKEARPLMVHGARNMAISMLKVTFQIVGLLINTSIPSKV